MSATDTAKQTIASYINGDKVFANVEEVIGVIKALAEDPMYGALADLLEHPDFALRIKMVPDSVYMNRGDFHQLKEYLTEDEGFAGMDFDLVDDVIKDILIILACHAVHNGVVTLTAKTPLRFYVVKQVVAGLIDLMNATLDEEEWDDDWEVDNEFIRPTAGDIDRIMDVLDNVAFMSHNGEYYNRLTDKCKERLLSMLHEDGMVTRI